MPCRFLIPVVLAACLLPAVAQPVAHGAAAVPGLVRQYQKTFVNAAGEGMRWDFDAREWESLGSFPGAGEAEALARKWNDTPPASDREQAIFAAGYRYAAVANKLVLRQAASPQAAAAASPPSAPAPAAVPPWALGGEVVLAAAQCRDPAEAEALAGRMNDEAAPGGRIAAARAAGYRFMAEDDAVVFRKPGGGTVAGPSSAPARMAVADRWLAGAAIRLKAGDAATTAQAESLAAAINRSLDGSSLAVASSLGYRFLADGKSVIFGVAAGPVANAKPASVAAVAPSPPVPAATPTSKPDASPPPKSAPTVAAGDLPEKLRRTFVNSAGVGMRYDFDLAEWAALGEQADADQAARLAKEWNEMAPGNDREETIRAAGFRYLAQGKRIFLRRTAQPGAVGAATATPVVPGADENEPHGAAAGQVVPDLVVRWSEEAGAFVGPDGQPVSGLGVADFRPKGRIDGSPGPAVAFADDVIVVRADPAKLGVGGMFGDPVTGRSYKASQADWDRGVVRSPANPAVRLRLPDQRPSYFRPLPDALKRSFTNALGLPMRWDRARDGWVNGAPGQIQGRSFANEVADNLNGKRAQAPEETAARDAGYRYVATADGQLALLLPKAAAAPQARPAVADATGQGIPAGASSSAVVTARWDALRIGWVRSDNHKLVATPGAACDPRAAGLVKDADGRDVLLLGKNQTDGQSLSDLPRAIAAPGAVTLKVPAVQPTATVAEGGAPAASVAAIPTGIETQSGTRVQMFRNTFGHQMEWNRALACYVRRGADAATGSTLVGTLNQALREGRGAAMETNLARTYGFAYFLRSGRLCFGPAAP